MKNAAHWRVFETVFEVYFSLRGREYALTDEQAAAMADLDELLSEMQSDQQGEQQGAGGVGDSMTPEELAEMLYKALAQGNEAMLKALARQAVQRYAGMEPGRPVGGTYYLYRTLRNLDLDGVLDKLMEQAREQAPEPLHAARGAARARRVRGAASTSCARRSRPRSAGGWSPTGASRPWPAPCASRCPRTSTSCTPAARRWRRCARRSTR